jgi:hypothetical protein
MLAVLIEVIDSILGAAIFLLKRRFRRLFAARGEQSPAATQELPRS